MIKRSSLAAATAAAKLQGLNKNELSNIIQEN